MTTRPLDDEDEIAVAVESDHLNNKDISEKEVDDVVDDVEDRQDNMEEIMKEDLDTPTTIAHENGNDNDNGDQMEPTIIPVDKVEDNEPTAAAAAAAADNEEYDEEDYGEETEELMQDRSMPDTVGMGSRRGGGRRTPARCKSAVEDRTMSSSMPSQAGTRRSPGLARSVTTETTTTTTTTKPRRGGGGVTGTGIKRSQTADGTLGKGAKSLQTTAAAARRKKKGIRVAITVRKDEAVTAMVNTLQQNDKEDLKIYKMDVASRGKFSGKGNWLDVDAFWTGRKIDKEIMCDLLAQYSQEQYPERRGADNLRPKRCYLRDEPLRGISFYKDYDWNPVKLNLKTDRVTPVEILERWTQRVTLEQIPVDYSTDLETALKERGDKAVTSTLKKSPLQGHPLAVSMMKSDTQLTTEFRGLESVVFVLGNHETPDDVDPETQEMIWRDVKTLRALLYDKPLPQKEGKGTQRMVEVVGLESYLKVRVHYFASFEGDVVSDHGVGLLLGERWWAHPLKDIMQGYGVENAARIYEDIELRFFSEIGYKMDNEYFDWENHGGKWIKVKKQRQQVTS